MPETKRVSLEQLSDLCTPWCVHTVATLKIAQHIESGIDRVEQLAVAAQCDPRVLHCVLGHLVSKGLFEEPEQGRFALNDAARGLLDPMQTIGLDLEGIGGRMAHVWGTMLRYVRTGSTAYEDVFGLPFWEDLDANPRVGESFDALIGLVGHGAPNPEFDITGGWSSIGSVVDVGGGTGLMLAEILRLRPHLRGILVDLPRPVARSAEVFHAAGVRDRATAAAQSFFDPLPGGADLYVLRGILNDWPDDGAAAILARCAEAAGSKGRVVVLGGVSFDGAPKRLAIEMVLLGGRHRTVSEMRELAGRAGLEVVSADRQAAYFVVECRPIQGPPA